MARASLGGHTFYGPWKPTHDPGNPEDALGTAEEFGNPGSESKSPPLGFTEAKPGERFVKIGVGVLQKPDAQPYQFSRAYPVVRFGTWTVRHGLDWIEFTQELAEGGWGSDLDSAFGLIVLLNSGCRGDALQRAADWLLARQQDDGGRSRDEANQASAEHPRGPLKSDGSREASAATRGGTWPGPPEHRKPFLQTFSGH